MDAKRAIYEGYLFALQKLLISSYESSGRKASGKFAEGMCTEVTDTRMTLYGASHSVFVERGRSAGAFPPRKAIMEWIEVKQGLPSVFKEKKEQFAFLIARKIAREGTRGSDVVESVIQEWIKNTMPKLLNELGQAYLVQIENDIVPLLKKMTR